jgi:phosphohistidine phosphatase
MRLILVQHGDALPENVDPERSLSEKGRMQAQRLAEFIKHLPPYPEVIIHSGKKRSKETAEIISFGLGGIRMEERSYLNPNDSIMRMLTELRDTWENQMIIGHMPYLGRLLSSLLFGNENGNFIEITNCSPVILKKDVDRYVLETCIRNEYLR